MSGLWPRPLKVGKVGDFVVREDSEWLGNGSISDCEATAGPEVEVVAAVPNGGDIVVKLRGVSPGLCDVHVEYSTSAGNTDCYDGTVKVVEC